MDITRLYSKFDKQEVIGRLKATGSRDKDVLFTVKTDIIKISGMTKFKGTVAMVAGVMLTITILGAILGIPLLIVGWWLRKRGVSNIEVTEAAYKEYIAGL